MTPLAIRVIAAAALIAAGWAANGWRLGEKIAQIERDQAIAAEAASETARLKERAWNIQMEGAKNEAIKREKRLRIDAVAARGAADGLRADLAEIRRQLPELAADACRVRVDTLAELFGECSARYSELAEKAGRHANDVQTLIDGWPK